MCNHYSATIEEPITLVFDYSKGQSDDYGYDSALNDTLVSRGYNILWAYGGLNSTILETADALIVGSVTYEQSHDDSEIAAISNWFNMGGKFLWVAGDSDYNNLYVFNENAYRILESVGSHVYPEQAIIKAEENCVGNQASKVIANITTQNPRFLPVVHNVTDVLMSHATTLYGSNSSESGHDVNPINLESNNISDVFQILYYNPTAYIQDDYPPPTMVHSDMQTGAFVAVTLEDNAGCSGNGVLVVSGSTPYGQAESMCLTEYYSERPLDGQRFIVQLIDFGIETALQYRTRHTSTSCTQTTPTATTPAMNTTDFDSLSPILVTFVGTSVVLATIYVIIKHKKLS
jgi:hypothetical protein